MKESLLRSIINKGILPEEQEEQEEQGEQGKHGKPGKPGKHGKHRKPGKPGNNENKENKENQEKEHQTLRTQWFGCSCVLKPLYLQRLESHVCPNHCVRNVW